MSAPDRRLVACVLSRHSLPYARLALDSLLVRCDDALDLHLITDDQEDAEAIGQALSELAPAPPRHRVSVHTQAQLDERAASAFAGRPHLQAFRGGHPCWRKLTDPLLLAGEGQDYIVLDPDLYFPNRFRFEPTPARGVLLMWQRPSCLLPPEVVRRAYALGVPMAHHVDIGVAHARRNWDLDWLNAFIGDLGGTALPRQMHIEAIVWAALAMREGGGHLDPTHWHCWQNTHMGRLTRRLGVSGSRQLRGLRWSQLKCFHGGGPAKWWLVPLLAEGGLPPAGEVAARKPALPFEPLTPETFEASQRVKDWAQRLGYHRLLSS